MTWLFQRHQELVKNQNLTLPDVDKEILSTYNVLHENLVMAIFFDIFM
jgi:hypothetical protein